MRWLEEAIGAGPLIWDRHAERIAQHDGVKSGSPGETSPLRGKCVGHRHPFRDSVGQPSQPGRIAMQRAGGIEVLSALLQSVPGELPGAECLGMAFCPGRDFAVCIVPCVSQSAHLEAGNSPPGGLGTQGVGEMAQIRIGPFPVPRPRDDDGRGETLFPGELALVGAARQWGRFLYPGLLTGSGRQADLLFRVARPFHDVANRPADVEDEPTIPSNVPVEGREAIPEAGDRASYVGLVKPVKINLHPAVTGNFCAGRLFVCRRRVRVCASSRCRCAHRCAEKKLQPQNQRNETCAIDAAFHDSSPAVKDCALIVARCSKDFCSHRRTSTAMMMQRMNARRG